MQPPNQPFVAVVLDREPDRAVMEHAVAVLRGLHIPHETVTRTALDAGTGLSGYLAGAAGRGLAVVVIGTYYAYTEEQFPTTADLLIPVIKVVTGPPPPTVEQTTQTIAITGYGPDGARNAGLLAARILAGNDPALAARLREFSPD